MLTAKSCITLWANFGNVGMFRCKAEKRFTSSIEDDLLLITVHYSDCALGADGGSCV